jgi:hypothetical protein
MIERRFGSDTSLADLSSHYGAFQHLLELCESRGINQVVPAAMDQIFQAGIKAGHGQEDFAILGTVMLVPVAGHERVPRPSPRVG